MLMFREEGNSGKVVG